MNKNFYLKLITFPILLLITVVSFITYYNMNSWKNHKDDMIYSLSKEFEKENKQKIYNDVHNFVKNIDYIRKEKYKNLKKRIKKDVDNLEKLLYTDYVMHKDIESQEQLKNELLELTRS